MTPRESLVVPRTIKDPNHDFNYLQSPNGKSLVIDESMRHERVDQKASQGTDQNYSRSNLYENSDGPGLNTVGRQTRMSKKMKKAKKMREHNKNNSLVRGSGNLPRDIALEQALEKEFLDSNHIILNENERNKSIDEDEDQQRKLEDIELHEYRKLMYDYRNLKAHFAKVNGSNQSKKEQLEKCKAKIYDLSNKLFDQES